MKLRDKVKLSPAMLAVRTRKWLSMANEYGKREAFRRMYFAERTPGHLVPAWTGKRKPLAPRPFESGPNVLPGLEKFTQ